MEFVDIVIASYLMTGLLECAAIALWRNGPATVFLNDGMQNLIGRIPDERADPRPLQRFFVHPALRALGFVFAATDSMPSYELKAAARLLGFFVTSALLLLAVYHLVMMIAADPGTVGLVLLILLPALVGLGIWFWASEETAQRINRHMERAANYHEMVRSRDSRFSRYAVRPATWGLKRIHTHSQSVSDLGLRAGVTVTAVTYWALIVVSLAVIAALTIMEVVLILIAVAIAVAVIVGFAGGQTSGGKRERVTRPERDFWGNDKKVIYEDGKKVGEQRNEQRGGFLGFGAESVEVTYDSSGREEGYSKIQQRGGILGIGAEEVRVHYDPQGRETGQTKIEERGGILGIGSGPVGVTYDADERDVSHTTIEKRGGILGIGAEPVKVTRLPDP